MKLTDKKLARFWSRVDKTDSCWVWTAGKSRGYGVFTLSKGHPIYAHRLAWELVNGPIPKGEGYHGTCVLHICDNPPCVNPSHLKLGTTRENTLDAIAKGRWADRKGDKHPRAKLSSSDVIEIVRLITDAVLTHREIGDRYSVSAAAIDTIKSGKNWGHLTGLGTH